MDLLFKKKTLSNNFHSNEKEPEEIQILIRQARHVLKKSRATILGVNAVVRVMGNDAMAGRQNNKTRTSLNCILCFRYGQEEDAALATTLKRPFKGSLAVLSPPYLVLTRKPLE